MSRADDSSDRTGLLLRVLCVLVVASACGGSSPTTPEPAPTPSSPLALVNGDPLTDLAALARVRLVLHDGVMIRGSS